MLMVIQLGFFMTKSLDDYAKHIVLHGVPVEELRGKTIGLNIKSKLNTNFTFGQTKPRQQSFRSKERTCFAFNRGESCNSGCAYKHSCAFCKSGARNKLNCPKLQAKSKPNQSTTQPINHPKQTAQPNKSGESGKHLQHCNSGTSKYLIEGFTYGFRLGCIEQPTSIISRNHSSIYYFTPIVDEKINRESALGRIAGHFESQP